MEDATPPGPSTPEQGPSPEHRMPGWVKGFVATGIAIGLLVVLALVVGGGTHGPARHQPNGGDAGTESPGGHTPPVDHG